IQKAEPGAQLREQVAGNLRLARIQLQLREKVPRLRDRLPSEIGDGAITEAHVQRDRAQPLTGAGAAGHGLMLVPVVPPDFLAALLLVEARHLDAGAEAAPAPAVLGVEREQARVQLGEAAPAGGA